MRLHGRDTATWQLMGKAASYRFNYDYSAEELQQLVPPLRALAQQVRQAHVVFNNCFEDRPQRNALSLAGYLGPRGGLTAA